MSTKRKTTLAVVRQRHTVRLFVDEACKHIDAMQPGDMIKRDDLLAKLKGFALSRLDAQKLLGILLRSRPDIKTKRGRYGGNYKLDGL